MARGGRDRAKERRELRDTMHQQGHTPEQIATAMARQFGDRPRPAWRHAHGWTQQDVADRYNREVNDKQSSMNANRISDYERWPINGTGVKPTVVPTLAVLARIYSTSVLKLVDRHDRQKMNNAELIALATVDSGVIPRQLPAAVSNFVGRAQELDILTAQLDRAVKDGGTVVITSIGGTAGIGKTTLAVYWARAHIDQFPDGQLYVDLRGFSPSGTPVTPAAATRGFLDAFQIPAEKIPVSPDDQASLYRTLVEGKQLVIVLDNARNADQVWPLLPGSPTCAVLVTSRQQLGGLIARKQALHITLEFMTAQESRQLLTTFLGPERIHAEPEAVNELIQRCVGLPIALSIAAARVVASPHAPLSTLVDQLREQHHRLSALATGDSQLTDIRAVFSWSYTALSPQAARLFRLLGLHPGPDIATLAAASLAGLPAHDTRELLTELTRAYLLDQHIPGRYQFHDLLRVYAVEQAAGEEPEPLRRAALHRVLDYYLHTGVAANLHLSPHRDPITLEAPQPETIPSHITDDAQAWEWFTAEHAVLLAAIDHAATDRFDTHAWQLPWTLATFLHRRGHWHDYVATQQTAVSAADRLGDRVAQALALRILGHAYAVSGRYADASAYFQQVLVLCRDLGDRTGQARTHLYLCWVCERQSQHGQALTHAQHALDLYRTTGNHVWQANALNYLGWYHALLGNHQQALTYCQQALNLNRELDDRRGEAHTLDSLGYAHRHLGHHDQAITHYQQALTLRREVGDHYHEASTLSSLGDTYHATGNLTAARQAWQEALTIFDQLGHPDADTVRTKFDTLDPNHS
ncbi:MAG: tetratricopeptide repeat protein [Pseudonocardiaceae bacterium]